MPFPNNRIKKVENMYDEKVIAEAVKKAMEQLSSEDNNQIKIGVSARHIHLSREDLDVLFGKGFELTWVENLHRIRL